MYRWSGGAESSLVPAVALVLLALVVLWLSLGGAPPQSARDFEACVEQVQAKRPSNDERGALITACGARFAGRRKAGGGYTYYDFMPDRQFDIAGSNPTGDAPKRIEPAYMDFPHAPRLERAQA